MKNIMSRWLAILALSLFLLSGCSNDSSSTGTITVPPDESAIVTENTENHQPDEPLMQECSSNATAISAYDSIRFLQPCRGAGLLR